MPVRFKQDSNYVPGVNRARFPITGTGAIRNVGIDGIINAGLVLYLDAGNAASYPGSGTTWTDLSGNGINGTLTNGVGYSSSNGGTLTFDGNNDYVGFSNNSLLNFGNNFTISAWCKPTQIGHFYGLDIVGLNVGFSAPYVSYGLEWMDTSKFRFDIGNTSNLFLNYESSSTYATNNWYYVVGTYDGSTANLYVNGISQNSTSVSTTVKYVNPQNLAVGTWYSAPDTSSSFPGSISVVHLYNRALSASEILQNYNVTKTRYGF